MSLSICLYFLEISYKTYNQTNHERVVKSEKKGMYTAIRQKKKTQLKNLSMPIFKNVILKVKTVFSLFHR